MTLNAASRGAATWQQPVDAFTGLYEREYPALAAYATRLTGGAQSGQDAAQEAFVRLYTRLRTVHEPRAWLYLVTTNIVRDRWKQQSRHRTALARLRPTWTELAPGPDLAVRDAVDRLPARLRSVVLLHYFADLPVNVVATATGLPAGTVKRRLHEARALLSQALQEDNDGRR